MSLEESSITMVELVEAVVVSDWESALGEGEEETKGKKKTKRSACHPFLCGKKEGKGGGRGRRGCRETTSAQGKTCGVDRKKWGV